MGITFQFTNFFLNHIYTNVMGQIGKEYILAAAKILVIMHIGIFSSARMAHLHVLTKLILWW